MVDFATCVRFGALAITVLAAQSAIATPPAPPAPLTWSREAWICPGRQRSSFEIEMLAQGASGYRLRVTEVQINARKIDPAKIEGLREILARRNFVRISGGYCERNGEVIGLEELANGPKADQAGWRRLYVPYATGSAPVKR